MFDRCGRFGLVGDVQSSMEALRGVPNRVVERDGVGLGGVDGALAGGVFCSSFFLMNQRLKPLPWTLIVSVADGSIPPRIHGKRLRWQNKQTKKNIQPMLIMAILNFFQVQR